MKIKQLIVLAAAFSLILILTGCVGPGNVPSPTEKKVNPGDIVGKWKYDMDFNLGKVSLELKPDRTFVQTIPATAPGGPRVQKGMWQIKGGSRLELNSALRFDNNTMWKPHTYQCWIVDGSGFNAPFGIFGGDGFQDDADSGNYWERVPQTFKSGQANLGH